VFVRILRRLAREPAAVGVLAASTLPAMTALGVISLDEQQIAVLVVGVNSVVGFVVRFAVSPTAQPST